MKALLLKRIRYFQASARIEQHRLILHKIHQYTAATSPSRAFEGRRNSQL